MGHHALTGWQDPTATKMHAGACPRSVVRERLRLERAVPVPGGHDVVARTGEIDPSAQGEVRKLLRSRPPKRESASRELPRDRVAPGRCRPRAPTDPYVPALGHIMWSTT